MGATKTSRNPSFVDRCGLAPPIDLVRPARERAAKSGCERNWCPEPTYHGQFVLGVCGTVRAWRTCWAVTRSGSGAVLAAPCGRISYHTRGAILSVGDGERARADVARFETNHPAARYGAEAVP